MDEAVRMATMLHSLALKLDQLFFVYIDVCTKWINETYLSAHDNAAWIDAHVFGDDKIELIIDSTLDWFWIWKGKKYRKNG